KAASLIYRGCPRLGGFRFCPKSAARPSSQSFCLEIRCPTFANGLTFPPTMAQLEPPSVAPLPLGSAHNPPQSVAAPSPHEVRGDDPVRQATRSEPRKLATSDFRRSDCDDNPFAASCRLEAALPDCSGAWLTLVMLALTSLVPFAACSTLPAISCV